MTVEIERVAATPPPRMTQQQRSARAREKLIGAAIALICDKGFAALTVADIASAAGMTRGAIQHHFEGRQELVLAILHEVESEVADSFAEVLIDHDHDLGERIDSLIDHLGAVGRSPAYLAVMDIWMATRSDAGLKDAVRESMLRASHSYRDLWQRAFRHDAPKATVSECRRVVVAALRGAVLARIFVQEPRSYALTLATIKTMVLGHMTAARDCAPK
jgi:AcrR family transcriptional regulator